MRFRFNGEVRLIASAVLGAAILVAPARAEDIVIKMWTLDNKGYKEFIAEAAESFKATHPNVTIEHQIFPGDPYKTALKVALVGSDGPDVFFNWAGDRATQLVKDKRLTPVNRVEQSVTYRRLYQLAERRGLKPAREQLPDIDLNSPKITRKLTTAWFADRCEARYRTCLARDAASASLPPASDPRP